MTSNELFAMVYLSGWAFTSIFFMLWECRFPCKNMNYYANKTSPARESFIWLCAFTAGLIWPAFWFTVGPELIRTRNGHR